MSDWTAQDATAAAVSEHGGEVRPLLLRQARESAGLHIAALAAALKVPVKKLEALEAGRYDELPDMVFARALASSACRHLKVDPAPVLEQIPAGVKPVLGDTGMAINTPFKAAAGGAPANPAGWLSRPAVLVALALMLGALVLVFLPDMARTPLLSASDPLPQSEPANAAAGDVASLAPVLTSTADNASPAESPQTTLGLTPTAVVADGLTSTAVVVAEDTSDASKLLIIRATGDSWVEVINGTGVVVIQRMLKQGDLVDFSAAPPYSVVVGRVDNAEVLVRGSVFDTAPFARNGVARFQVK